MFGPSVITTVPLLSLYSLEIENQSDRTLNCILKSYCNSQNKIILSITVFKYHVVNAKIIIIALYLNGQVVEYKRTFDTLDPIL